MSVLKCLDEQQNLDPHQTKYVVVRELIIDITRRKSKHYEAYKHLRSISTWFEVTSNILHTTTVTSLFVSLTTLNPVVPIIGASISSTNFILCAIKQGYHLNEKLNRYHVSQSQYEELLRDINARLAKNSLTTEEILSLINDINMRIDLIHDSSLE
jgi:hypothetical protein